MTKDSRDAQWDFKKTYRCAVIGCGWIGAKRSTDHLVDGVQSHAQAYDLCEDTELVGLSDSDPESLAKACSLWPSARGFEDIGSMLAAEKPDIVTICTPDDTHYTVCQQVLSAPSVKAIIIEKPITTELAEAEALLSEAGSKNILVMVDYSRRFTESHMAIKKRITDGEIGEIIAVMGTYSKGIFHIGSHWFDLARWLVGEITEVEAWADSIHLTPDPTCHVRVSFNGGIQGFLVGLNVDFSVFELDVIGSLGRIRIRDCGHLVESCYVQPSQYYTGYSDLGGPTFQKAGFNNFALRLVENTVQSLRGNESPLCSGLDGFSALNISEMACRSLRSQVRLSVHCKLMDVGK